MSTQLPNGSWISEQEKKLLDELQRKADEHLNNLLWWGHKGLNDMTGHMRKQAGVGLLTQVHKKTDNN
jgi:hypothetical protein